MIDWVSVIHYVATLFTVLAIVYGNLSLLVLAIITTFILFVYIPYYYNYYEDEEDDDNKN